MPKPYALQALSVVSATFGDEALFDPDGARAPCRVIWADPEGDGGFFEGGRAVNADGKSGLVDRVGEFGVPEIVDEDLIEITEAGPSLGRWRVIGDAVHPDNDPDGLTWHVILAREIVDE